MKGWWTATLVALLGIGGGGTHAPAPGAVTSAPARYASNPWADGSRLVLQCEGSGVSSSVCAFWKQGDGRPAGSKTVAEFLSLDSQQQYLKRLVGLSAGEAVKNPQGKREASLAPRDMPLLQALAANQDACLADRAYADLLLACPVSEQASDSVVLFFRGLCDRCRFEPVVLRKVN